MKKPTDRTKTTPEIHQQIKIQAAQAKMKIAQYIKMLLDNDKNKTNIIKGLCYYDEVAEFPSSKLEEAMERAKSFNSSGKRVFIRSTERATKDNDKKQINFNCNNYQEVIDLLNTIDEKVTVIINVNSTRN